ncbi:MAG: GDP-L-fucose synthase [Candidatus Aceula meridiana]|nr:GDP-L-fucose synthase [Candidatus Aceula meridiana]
MEKNSKIFIVGHKDVVEESLIRYFKENDFTQVFSSSQLGLDTTIQSSVNRFFADHKPDYVFLNSIRAGGIKANQENPAEFFYANSASQNNVIYAAHKFATKKLLYFSSSCIYPKSCPQPMNPEYLMTSPMESTSAAYSTAKLAGVKLCQAYRAQYGFNAIVAVVATAYGVKGDIDASSAHVLDSLIAKFYEAKVKNQSEVVLWGSGQPCREFISGDDVARAAVFLMKHYNKEIPIHIGCGKDISIKGLAQMIKEVSGFNGNVVFDPSHPDGAMRKLLDNEPITKLGWVPQVDIQKGIQEAFNCYQQKMEFKK